MTQFITVSCTKTNLWPITLHDSRQTVSDVRLKLGCFQSTSTYSALEASHFMRYINSRLTDLLTRAGQFPCWSRAVLNACKNLVPDHFRKFLVQVSSWASVVGISAGYIDKRRLQLEILAICIKRRIAGRELLIAMRLLNDIFSWRASVSGFSNCWRI